LVDVTTTLIPGCDRFSLAIIDGCFDVVSTGHIGAPLSCGRTRCKAGTVPTTFPEISLSVNANLHSASDVTAAGKQIFCGSSPRGALLAPASDQNSLDEEAQRMKTLDAPEATGIGAEQPCVRARYVAAAAAEHAVEVDCESRFPFETFAAARQHRLLSMLVPVELGGDGATVSDAVDVCYMLGTACGSSAMIFAMHQIQVVILLRHAKNSPWHERLLRRLCDEQLLFASSTTENQTGGAVRASSCAVERDGARMSLVKNGTVMSYGAEADGILLTARRAADAAPSDQVLVAFVKGDYELEKIKEWDTMGMRGTSSTGYTLRGSGSVEQIIPESYERIHPQSMVPIAHLTWSGVWCGIAAGAVARARRFVRKGAAQGNAAQAAPGASHLTRAMMSLRALRGSIAAAVDSYENAAAEEKLEAIDVQAGMNLLKVNSSELAITTVLSALQACGLSGYRNDGEFSVARNLRDVLSSAIMINNERILASTASSLLLFDVPARLRD
jgi:acyl-CoA dehydrogenase